MEHRIGQEIEVDALGDEFKGYVFRIAGGQDKDGFPMKQGVLVNGRVRLLLAPGDGGFRGYNRRTGERRRKSVRGCITGHDLSVLNVTISKKGEGELPGLTDGNIPRRKGPKRASKIRKLFNLTKADDVRKFVIRRPLAAKEGKKADYKCAKIQRLVTPITLQRKRRLMTLKKKAAQKTRTAKAVYADMMKTRRHEQAVERKAAHAAAKLAAAASKK